MGPSIKREALKKMAKAMPLSSAFFLKFRKYYTSEVCLEIKKRWISVNKDMGDGDYKTLDKLIIFQ